MPQPRLRYEIYRNNFHNSCEYVQKLTDFDYRTLSSSFDHHLSFITHLCVDGQRSSADSVFQGLWMKKYPTDDEIKEIHSSTLASGCSFLHGSFNLCAISSRHEWTRLT